MTIDVTGIDRVGLWLAARGITGRAVLLGTALQLPENVTPPAGGWRADLDQYLNDLDAGLIQPPTLAEIIAASRTE